MANPLHAISPPDLLNNLIQQGLTDEEQHAAILEACRQSLRQFTYWVIGEWTDWSQVKSEDDINGNAIPSVYEEAWHLLAWYHMLETYPRICCLAARGFHKSGTFSWAYPLWRAWKDNGVEGLLVSSNETQAGINLSYVKAIIEANPILAPLKPSRPTKWGSLDILCTNGSQIRARGQGSAIRGLHPSYVVCDDLLDEKNSGTPEQREKVATWYRKTLEPMLTSMGSTLALVGTPQAWDDILLQTKENPLYCWTKWPAEITQDEKAAMLQYLGGAEPPVEQNGDPVLLWEDKYSKAFLESKRGGMNAFTYAQEYMCSPSSDEAMIFQQGWIRYYQPEWLELPKRQIQLPEDGKPQQLRAIYTGVDLAIGQKQKNDYFAIVTIGCTDTRIFVLDAFHGKLSFLKQVEKIHAVVARYNPDLVLIESNAYQMAMRSYLSETSTLPVKPFHTTNDKTVRASRISSNFENGQVYLREDMYDLQREIVSFPLAEHDDLLDAIGYAIAFHHGRSHTKSRTGRR